MSESIRLLAAEVLREWGMEAEKIQSFIRKHDFLRAISQLSLTCSFCQNLLPHPQHLSICGLEPSVRATQDLCSGYRTRVRDVLCEIKLPAGAGCWSWVSPNAVGRSLPVAPCPSSSLLHEQWSLSLSVLELPGSLQHSGGTATSSSLGQSHCLQQSCFEP